MEVHSQWTVFSKTEGSNGKTVFFYLVVKRSVGSFFDRRLFLFIANLNHHAGVNVFPHKLSGFCDIDGNLQDKLQEFLKFQRKLF